MHAYIKLGQYESVAVVLTGNELEQLTNIVAKMVRVDRRFLGDNEVYVKNEKERLEFECQVLTSMSIVGHDIYEQAHAKQKCEARAALVKGVIEGNTSESNLIDNLWYDGIITKTQKDTAVIMAPYATDYLTLDVGDGRSIGINLQGDVTTFIS
jgi:hypothetical protein